MKLLNKVKNSKGLNTIETVILSLIVIVAVCGLLDLTNVMRKQHTVSSTANYVARTIGKQGGIRQNKPSYYPGNYISSASLYSDVKKSLNDAGIADDDWELTIKTPKDGTVDFTPYTNLSLTEKGKDMEVTLTINYYWNLSAQVSPIKLKGTNTAKRVASSTFKIREGTSANTEIK